MLLGAAPLGVYALTQLPLGTTTNLPIVKGDLTLTGQSVAFDWSIAVTKGDLTLNGKPVAFNIAVPIVGAALTLTGEPVTLDTAIAVAKGDLTLTGFNVELIAGSTFPIGSATLTLTPHWVDLVVVGGASGNGKKRTGFEPVKKLPPRPTKPEPPKVWTPPKEFVRSPSIVPRRPAPDLVERELIPTDLLGIEQQMRAAEDISDVNRFLEQLEYDEQDAADIADVLALLDD